MGGHTIGKYSDAVHAEVLDDLRTGPDGYKYRLLDGIVMPPYITPPRYNLSRTIEMRNDDICFTGFPKSGSTWLSYILVLITNGGQTPSGKTLRDCLHWVASSFTYPRSRQELDADPSPRIFKSHMPYSMAVGGAPAESPCRYIYIARNPKDVAVSYFHFEREKSWAGGFAGNWEVWLEMFLSGKVQRGDWFDHVLSWWEHRDAANILFVKYEDLKNNFENELKRLVDFLGYDLPLETMALIKQQTAFDTMRQGSFSDMHEIEELHSFFREGRVGSWRDQFSESDNKLFDSVCEQRLAASGLTFEFD